ncbi:hypothetical protein [Streptomyces sp. MZ04]|uniref:hypothetical protein n=1 Tax=Streptomyces sp. MZ04 TaxID=2559236 RepID=UPI00107EE831|nr:hypothetical protein [Streptomyces sp. MZ04]TGB08260.1 hypothetical protein E2651_19830 [Streptomyces sp. MZ04]
MGLATVGLSLATVGVITATSQADDKAVASRQDDAPDHGNGPQVKAQDKAQDKAQVKAQDTGQGRQVRTQAKKSEDKWWSPPQDEAQDKRDVRRAKAPTAVEHDAKDKGYGHRGTKPDQSYGRAATAERADHGRRTYAPVRAEDKDYTPSARAKETGYGQDRGQVPDAANSQDYGQSVTRQYGDSQYGDSQYGTDGCATSDRTQTSDQYAPQDRSPRSDYGWSGFADALSRYGL